MRWVYLSPHFDDIALSCGGMVWEQTQAGQAVEIWTVCAGAPDAVAPGALAPLSSFAQALHQRWQTGGDAVADRRAEDDAALQRLGARARYWTLPDAIYRRLPDQTWLVNGEESLFQPINPQEKGILDHLVAWLASDLDMSDTLVSPLTLGNHVDHYLVRAAAEHAAAKVRCGLLYYPDYPYVAKPQVDWSDKIGEGWQQTCRAISPAALLAWQDAVACYTSQVSTFFKDRPDLDASLGRYLQTGGGACLWQPA